MRPFLNPLLSPSPSVWFVFAGKHGNSQSEVTEEMLGLMQSFHPFETQCVLPANPHTVEPGYLFKGKEPHSSPHCFTLMQLS